MSINASELSPDLKRHRFARREGNRECAGCRIPRSLHLSSVYHDSGCLSCLDYNLAENRPVHPRLERSIIAFDNFQAETIGPQNPCDRRNFIRSD